MPMTAIVAEPLVSVDERAADEQADRLEPERDHPRRHADPAEQVVGRVGGPQREVRHEDHRLRETGHDSGGDLDGDRRGRPPWRPDRRPSPGSSRRGSPRPGRAASGGRATSDPPTVPTPNPTRIEPEDRRLVTEVAGDVDGQRRHERRHDDRGGAPEQDRGAQRRVRRGRSRSPRGSRPPWVRADDRSAP